MSSTNEPSTESPKATLPQEQASPDKPSPKSSPVTATLEWASLRGSRVFSDAELESSSSRAASEWMMLSSCAAPTPQKAILSTRTLSSMQSTKRMNFDTVVPAGQKLWRVAFHKQVGKEVAGYGLLDARFAPTIRELIDALTANPKQFLQKKGKLKDARAAHLKFENVEFVAVFTLNEAARFVTILSLASHDTAEQSAEMANMQVTDESRFPGDRSGVHQWN